jgi:8-oxo-dGTP diphosphatase
MPVSPYIAHLRKHIGHATLVMPACAAITFDPAGRLLLIRRGDGRGWSLPGGMLEPGERMVECLAREVGEETGLEVQPVRLVGVYSDPAYTHITYPNGDRVHFVSATFECRVVGGELKADGDESLDVAYFSPQALPQPIVCDHEARIWDALSGREAAFFR